MPPSSRKDELEQGQVLGKYRILRKVGEGGFGRVYEAEELEGARRVALKVGRSPQHAGRMVREARLAARLKSPHSVRVLGVDRLEDKSPLIVMELLEGISLREYLAMRGRVEPPLALEWARQLAKALEEAHSIGLVHRDLKPSNLFIAKVEGGTRLKLLDFGLARALGGSEEHSVTGSGLVLGSPAYMSPEQIRSDRVTPRSDIWSFGVIVYEMLAGKRPFNAENNAGLLAAIAADPPKPLESARSGLSPGIHRLVERCLRKRPDERFANVRELLAALDALDVAQPNDGSDSLTATVSAARPAATASRVRRSHLGFLFAVTALGFASWHQKSRNETLVKSEASRAASSAQMLPEPSHRSAAEQLEAAPSAAPSAASSNAPVPATARRPAPTSSSAPLRRSREQLPVPTPSHDLAREGTEAAKARQPFFAAPDF